MTIALTGNGSVGQRLGHIFGIAADIQAIMGGTATAGVTSAANMATRAATLETDAAYSTQVSAELGDHWGVISSWRSSQTGLLTALKSIAEKELIRMADADASLTEKTLTAALLELRRQMRAGSTSIEAGTFSAGSQTNGTPTPTGTSKVVTSVKDNEGYALQNLFAEMLRITCTSDAQTGGATAGNESYTVKGKAAAPSVWDYQYSSYGSGCNKTVNGVDSESNNSRGNILTSSSFNSFNSTHYPANFVSVVGTAGTHFTAGGSGDALDGDNCLKIISDGSTLTAFTQAFDTAAASTTANAGGTPYELLPLTTYGFGVWLKSSDTLDAGVLTISLVNGSGTVTADDSGTNNSVAVDCTALTTSWAFYSGVFRTPSVTPASGYKLKLAITTSHTSGESVFVDKLAMTPMTQLYPGGVHVAVFSGATEPVKGDNWTVAISASRGKVADWLDRFFDMRGKGIQLPYSGSPTLDDDLVV